jgi:serine protease Do
MQEEMETEPEEAGPEAREPAGASLGAESINFALPAEQVWYAARMIRTHGRVIRLGLTATVPEEALVSQVGRRGLLVDRVEEGSPAARAMLGPNDLLVEFGGCPVGSLVDLRRAIVASPVEGAIPIVVVREGNVREITLTYE